MKPRFLKNIGFYSAVLIFLNSHKIKISKDHLAIIGNEGKNLPNFDKEWAEVILNYILFEDQKYFVEFLDFKQSLLKKLTRNGLVDNNKINFKRNENVDSKLINSISKLNSIKEIVDFEYEDLKSNLRLVILTDYIRKEYFTTSLENDIELKRIGVLSIFEKLRRENLGNKKIAVLTGSIVILPAFAKELFLEKISQKNIKIPDIFKS